ncbi:MAG: FHA domain-containing protein [Anaerolineae bacterium]
MVEEKTAALIHEGGARHPLDQPRVTLGRADDNDVVVDDTYASRMHAEVVREGHRFVVRDLDSTNGTFVNGRRLTAPHLLSHSDEVRIGGARFTFIDPNVTAVAPPAGGPLLRVDEVAGDVWIGQERIQLTAKEYQLLLFLYRRAGQVCSKDEIGQAVWPEYEGIVYDHNVESLMNRLRHKIEPEPADPRFIVTLRGRGYKLVLGEE